VLYVLYPGFITPLYLCLFGPFQDFRTQEVYSAKCGPFVCALNRQASQYSALSHKPDVDSFSSVIFGLIKRFFLLHISGT